jgi:hypothetical protein
MAHLSSVTDTLPPLSPVQAVTNPTNTVYATKRLIGRKFEDSQTQKEAQVGQATAGTQDRGKLWQTLGPGAGCLASTVCPAGDMAVALGRLNGAGAAISR